MSADIQPDFMVGEDPDPDLLDETLWARQAIRDSLKVLDATLQRLVTLCSALLAGSAAFFGQIHTLPLVKTAAVVCFMAGLAASLWGIVPATRQLNPCLPQQAKAIREGTAAVRRRCVWLAAGSVFVGFVVLFIGLAA